MAAEMCTTLDRRMRHLSLVLRPFSSGDGVARWASGTTLCGLNGVTEQYFDYSGGRIHGWIAKLPACGQCEHTAARLPQRKADER